MQFNSKGGSLKFLIVGPSFFSYTKSISKVLNERGYECKFYDELHSNNIFVKILYRLNLHFLFKNKISLHRENLYKILEVDEITDVIFISPDVLDSFFLESLRSKCKLHLYMWDGFKNKKNALNYMDLFDSKSSFDMNDCVKYNMNYLPLFAESVYSIEPKHNLLSKKIDISFCGTLHSNRANCINFISKFALIHGLNTKFYLYYYSPLLLIVRLFINKLNFHIYNLVSFESFTKTDISMMFKNSNCVLDITHPNQVGLTSRTFEALRSGAKLITNNKRASELNILFPGRIYVINDFNNLNDNLIPFIHSSVPLLDNNQDYFLSVERFTDQFLEFIND